MTKISFPYQLKEGQIAYARHVMANFNTLLNAFFNLQIEGVSGEDIQSILQELVDNKITANEAGNAEEIIFSDGETMQEKLDRGAFNGAQAAYYYGFSTFDIDADGNLRVTVTNGSNPFSINENGELICTIPEEDTSDLTTFVLGNVIGPQGEQGEQGPAAPESTTYNALILAADGTGENPTAWDNRETIGGMENSNYRRATIACEGVTATNNFIVQPHSTQNIDTDTAAWTAWGKAGVRVESQDDGSFVLYAKGVLPTIDISIDIVCDI